MALIVNGEKVEAAAIEREAERLRPRYEDVFADQDPKEREARLLEWSRENVIERILINQEAKKHGEAIPAEQVESALAQLKEQYKDKEQFYKDFDADDDEKVKQAIEQQIRVEMKLEEICGALGEPSKDSVKAYYEENKEQFKSGEQVRVAHIVKYVNWQTDEPTAHEAMKEPLEELKKGVAFELVANKHTDCSDSGGDLGYVMRGQMVEEFEDVVFNLAAGEVSDVFRTRFGFHIAKVYERRPPAAATLEQVKSRIVETLKEEMREEAINGFIDGLKGEASIEDT